MKDKFVLKLGGSLLYETDVKLDTVFLRKFASWFSEAKERYHRIVIVIGGGKMSRYLVNQARDIGSLGDESLHRIGMAVTNTNAEILRSILNDSSIMVPKTLGQALEMVVDDGPKFVITGGFKEGWSTDMDAAVVAHVIGAKKVYKLSNIDYVYTADPKVDFEARPIKDLTWDEYFRMFKIKPGMTQHQPGLSVPIGAYCAQFASVKGLTFNLTGGDTLLEASSLWEVFQSGTLIHP